MKKKEDRKRNRASEIETAETSDNSKHESTREICLLLFFFLLLLLRAILPTEKYHHDQVKRRFLFRINTLDVSFLFFLTE
jgi:hypothetical protein